jgi:hypothetical protein
MFAMVFRCFCKCFRCMFQVFYLSYLYVATIVSGCFKSRSGLHMGCEWEAASGAGDVRGDAGSARALACKPNALWCSLAR